jgi:hypothetical protein
VRDRRTIAFNRRLQYWSLVGIDLVTITEGTVTTSMAEIEPLHGLREK